MPSSGEGLEQDSGGAAVSQQRAWVPDGDTHAMCHGMRGGERSKSVPAGGEQHQALERAWRVTSEMAKARGFQRNRIHLGTPHVNGETRGRGDRCTPPVQRLRAGRDLS
eukprot:763990-Hanusia_phi.AAC.9